MKRLRPSKPVQEDKNDLGFGSRLSQQQHSRMMNRDGTFNVDRDGMSFVKTMSIYHWLLTMSWTRFFVLTAVFYFVINFLFAFGYYFCGGDALNGTESTTFTNHFWNCFFFSVETFATIGYGALNPRNAAANWLMTIEAFAGLVGAALVTGLLFARFARPNAKILYSRNAVIAPFKNGKALMVRIINQRSSQLINIEAQIIFSWMQEKEGRRVRQYHSLPLDRQKVTFFPLHWTIVHEIDEKSPLHNSNTQFLRESETEMFVLITATDETYSQTVHSRSSYRYDEIVWDAKFKDIFEKSSRGKAMGVNMNRIHDYEHLSGE
ncbi:MAG: ion channel [Bacteriovoracaceae bacterium]|nr:ion channel [Bacteroidota bacterium]